MKRLFCIILFFSISAYSQYYSTISGGLALAIGEGSENMNPGPSVSLESNALINKYFGIGGHIEYCWLSLDTREFSITAAGDHMINIGLVPKFYIPVNKDVNFFLEIDPAYVLDIAYLDAGEWGTKTEAFSGFLMTYGTGFSFKQLSLGFKIKTGFFKEGDTSNWITFSIGYIFS